MTGEMMTAMVALRDQVGIWYVLTPEMLAKAKATSEQQAQLEQQAGDDTAGFSIIVHDLLGSPLALKPIASPDATAFGQSDADTAGFGVIIHDFGGLQMAGLVQSPSTPTSMQTIQPSSDFGAGA